MATKRKNRRELRDETIRKEFNKRTKQKHLDSEYVVEELAKESFLEASTVWRIIKKTGHYKSDTDTENKGQ